MRLASLAAAVTLWLVIILQPLITQAAAYQPGEPLHIISHFTTTDAAEEWTSERKWQVLPGKAPSEAPFSLEFFSENTSNPLARLLLSRTGVVQDFKVTGVSVNVLKKKDLLIIPGYPVPCDILPVHRVFQVAGEGSSLHYTVKRRIGGQVFADELEIRMYPVSTEKAASQGWLQYFANDGPLDLYAIEAVNLRTTEVLSMQLWQRGADWWMYEETPNRRSWRVVAE